MTVAFLQGVVLLALTAAWGGATWILLAPPAARDDALRVAMPLLRAGSLGLLPAILVRTLAHAADVLGEHEGSSLAAFQSYVAWTPQGKASLAMALPALLLPIAVVALAGRAPATVLASAALAHLVVIAGAQASQGHAQILERPITGAVVDGIHLVAALTWIGGLVALLGSMASGSGEGRTIARFSQLALLCVVALVASGTGTYVLHFGASVRALGTPWGVALLAKSTALATMVGLAALHRRRLGRGLPLRPGAVAAESVLGLAAILLASLLTQLDPHAADLVE